MVQSQMVLCLLSSLFSFFHTAAATQYFVQLKTPATFETLLKTDDVVKAVHHLRPLVRKAFSFGNFEGFSANFDSDILSRLRKNPLVEEITPDIIVKTCDFDTQQDSPRHLARLSSRYASDEDEDSYQYYYPSEFKGQNINAYVIDTGVQCENEEFEGRCVYGADFTDEGNGDRNGHGTHVAGVIGSKTYGVAKEINIVAIKSLDRSGTGSLSSIISGIEFAVNHKRDSGNQGLINLSIGAFRNSVLNKAVESAFNAGSVLVAAAGNSNIDACATSPASAKHAITVGAIDDRTDALATFSNWGRCVNVLASGVRVASVNSRGEDPLLLSGTSMSTPSVAGVVGISLSAGVPPEEIKERIKQASTMGAVPRSSLLSRPITPNRIVYLPYDDIQAEEFNPFYVELKTPIEAGDGDGENIEHEKAETEHENESEVGNENENENANENENENENANENEEENENKNEDEDEDEDKDGNDNDEDD